MVHSTQADKLTVARPSLYCEDALLGLVFIVNPKCNYGKNFAGKKKKAPKPLLVTADRVETGFKEFLVV